MTALRITLIILEPIAFAGGIYLAAFAWALT